MNSIQMSTDKVLLTVFVSLLVGFLTAALSIVRLVNDKESKTTDYRQTWNDSLRKCFAALISNINTLASLTTYRMASADGIEEVVFQKIKATDKIVSETAGDVRAYLDKRMLEQESHILDLKRAMHESYALTRLHFKPNDLSFARVEQKFDLILELFAKLESFSKKESEGERLVLREKIHSAAGEITAFSRDILKTEWEAVKRGESAYQRTKFWSVVGGAIALVGLIMFGLATVWAFLRADSVSLKISTIDSTNSAGSYHVPAKANAVDISSAPAESSSQTNQIVTIYNSKIPCGASLRPTSKPIPLVKENCQEK